MWKPPADQVETDTGWRPPTDAVITEEQAKPGFLDTLSNAADKISSSMPYAAGLMAPTLGLGYKVAEEMNKASGQVGEATTEATGRAGVPGPIAASIGMLGSIASNPMTYVNPGTIAGKAFVPEVPASRAFDVATAEKYGLPLTRADITGSKPSAMVESSLSRTITGSGPFQRIAEAKLAAIDRAKTYIGSKFGTEQPSSASGLEAKLSMQGEIGAAHQTARQLYKDIPDVPIPISNLQKAINDLDFGNIDKSASSTINEIKGRLGKQAPATEETVPTMGAQYSVKPTSPDLPIISDKANTTGEPYAVFQGNMNAGHPNQYSTYIVRGNHPRTGGNFGGEDLVQMRIPVKGMTQRAADMGHQPVNPPQGLIGDVSEPPTFQKLNDIRNFLSREIQSDTTYNPIAGNQIGQKAQALAPLKKALDQDLQDYVKSNQDNPVGKMQSNEFSTAFAKANAFYGNLKGLQGNKFVQKLSRVPESDLPQTVFGTGRIEDINVAKAVLGQKGFNTAKQQFFNDLLDSKNIETRLGKYDNEFLQGVFNEQELNALREAASLKRTSLTAEKLAGNPSGTAQVVSGLATGGALIHPIMKAITHPLESAIEAGAILGGPYAASRAYLHTTRGIPYSYGVGSMVATRAAASATSSNRQDIHAEFIRRYIKGDHK